MRILSLETSGHDASLAALETSTSRGGDPELLQTLDVTGNHRTAQALAPALKQLLEAVNWKVESIELVTVAVGPGSFTGLRIGVTMAKTLAYAVGAEVIGVDTLTALADEAPLAASPMWAVMDAQRQELFAARFESAASGERIVQCETQILPRADWLASVRQGDWVTGPALGRLREGLPADVCLVDEPLWRPRASAVARVGWRAYHAGRRDDLWKLLPVYFRPSAAEEKAARAQG